MRRGREWLTRRGFLQVGAAASTFAAIHPLVGCSSRVRVARPAPLPGVTDLVIEEPGIEIGGRDATATALNGTVPGPLLRFREGEEVAIRVTNGLADTGSIHWHGLIVPAHMDGVPGLSFEGIPSGQSFTYRFPLLQYGTYWYHSHSAFQEQTGVYGPLVIDPAAPDPIASEREHVVMLSDWTFEDPHEVLANLKRYPGYYNFQRRTLGTFVRDSGSRGLWSTIRDRLSWGRMRMDPTDIVDVTGATLSFLLNGRVAATPWSGTSKPGERVRLRLINAAASTTFDVRVPGLRMSVVQADGQNVRPVVVDELRMMPAETYDVVVETGAALAYAVYAEAIDRTGFAAGMLVQRPGAVASLPPRRTRPLRSMADMGHDMAEHAGHGQAHASAAAPTRVASAAAPSAAHEGHTSDAPRTDSEHAGHDMSAMSTPMSGGLAPAGSIPSPAMHAPGNHGPSSASVAMMSRSRLHEPGTGLEGSTHRVLVYTDLVALEPHPDQRQPTREIELHLTGNMERFMWTIDGKKLSEAEPVRLRLGERVRMTLVNDTMMEHPMHLHGMWMVLENGHGPAIPRKHTIMVKPAERLSYLVTADNPGRWAFHCHILYHMEVGMFRVVEVTA